MKDHYYDDLAIQYYVIKNAGLPIVKANLVHINADYVRQGDIDTSKLFTVVDLTDDIEKKQGSVKENIIALRDMLKGNTPNIDIGEHCGAPYECDFKGHCWKHIPNEYPVFDLKGRGLNSFELYRKGILRLKDIPTADLNFHQRLQVEGIKEKKNYLDKEALKEFLGSLWHPLCFLDFECIYGLPIPLFEGTWPYQHIPYQYSLHRINKSDAELEHFEFLAEQGKDGRRELIGKLITEIPDNSCVIAYNAGYERRILKELAYSFPKYEREIAKIIDNVYDLAVPFRNKYIYNHEMNGSFSLKVVLPLLVPELSYEGLQISDGEEAMSAYLELWEEQDKEKTQGDIKALLEYCGQDSLGTVRIYQKLKEFI